MARGNTSTAHVVISMEGQQAVNLMKALQNQVKRTRQELEAMERAGQMDTDDYKNKQKELQSMERAIRANRTAYIDLDKIVKNLSGTTLGQLQKALKECRKQMQNLSADDPQMKKLVAQYRAIDNQIGSITGQWKRQDGAIKSVIERLTVYVSVCGAFNFIKNQLSSIAKENLKFSDSLADIRKTTGLSEKQVFRLSDALNSIDTRTSREELHKLAYEAGRMGLGKYGVEGVEDFVRAANKLKVALGEDLGEDAIVQLTKIADVTGDLQKYGVEGSMLKIGSAINELTQNITASGQFISDYMMRLSGIATQAHMTSAELAGLAAAADATGQEVEVSATAMNKFVVQLQTHYKTVAKAAGMSAKELHSMLEDGRTTDAVLAVLQKLNEKGGLSMLAPLMKDLGSDGSRLTASLSTLAQNIDLVREQVALSNAAFKSGTSVINEYNVKNENAAAIWEKMLNSWDKLFTNSANTGVVKDLAQDLYEFSKELQRNDMFMTALHSSLAILIGALKVLTQALPYLLYALPSLIFYFKSDSIIAFGRNILTATKYIKGLITASTTATAATRTLNTTMKMSIWGAIGALITSAVVALVDWSQQAAKAKRSTDALSKSYKQMMSDALSAQDEANKLFAKLKTTTNKDERLTLIAQINKNYGAYLQNLLTEKDSLDKVAEAQKRVNEQLLKSIAYKAQEKRIEEITSQSMERQGSNLELFRQRATSVGISNMDLHDTQAFVVDFVRKEFERVGNKPQTVFNALAKELAKRQPSKYSKGNEQNAYKDLFSALPGYGEGGRSFSTNPLEQYGAFAAGDFQFDEATSGDRKILAQTYVKLHGGSKSSNKLLQQWNADAIGQALRNYVYDVAAKESEIFKTKEFYEPIIGDWQETLKKFEIVESQSDSEKNKEKNAALKKAKDEHDAVMSAIEVYYKMEQQVVNEQYLKGEIAAAEHEQKLAEIEDRGMNTRIAARKALLGRDGASEEWLAELDKMDKEALSITDETQQAMLNLRGKNLTAIGAALRKFGDGEMDGIWKKMEEDRVKGQEQQIKMQKEVEAILLKYDYTGKVTDQFLASMQKLGYFKSEITNEAGEIVSLSRAQLETEFEKLYTIYNDLFSIDIATPEGIEEFKAVIDGLGLSSVNLEAFKKSLQGLGLTSEQEAQRISEYLTLLYDKTVEYGDAMVEAEEKARKRQLKISDALYKRTPQYKQDKARKETEDKTTDVYKYAQQLGLASDIMVQDQEVKLFEARLEAAKNYYEYLKSTGADTTKAELELQEATAELASAITGQIKEKLDVLRSYGDNLEQFGTDFGEAMFGSLDDRQNALESFVRAVGKSTQELIMNWVKQKIEHAILRKAMVKMEGQAQKQMTGAVEEGQEMETAVVQEGQKAITSAVTQMGAQAVQAKKTQAAESVSTQASETTASASLGIAEGAAKTIGKLGWWGIPLVAVITALINGLLSAAMSKVGSLFGGSSADAGAATPKLITGMLTYDSGNVQSVLGDNGSVYSARMGGVSGTGLVSVPTLTNVGGQAALVGEEGPEIVIGRATTRALQQDNSGLLQGLIHFDRLHSGRGFRRFDSGNIGAFGGATNDETTARMLDAVILALAPTLAGVQESLQASAQANLALRDRLNKPIQSVINKNGRGGLIDEVATGLEQEKRMGRSEVVKRLFR